MSSPIPDSLRRNARRDGGDNRVEPTLPPATNLDDYAPKWEPKPPHDPPADPHRLLGHLANVLQDRLCEIAHLLVKLTYTDTMTLAKGIGADPEVTIKWAREYIDNFDKQDPQDPQDPSK